MPNLALVYKNCNKHISQTNSITIDSQLTTHILYLQAYRNVQYVPPAITTNMCHEGNNNSNDVINNKPKANLNISKRGKNSLLCPHSNCTIIPEETQINVSPGECALDAFLNLLHLFSQFRWIGIGFGILDIAILSIFTLATPSCLVTLTNHLFLCNPLDVVPV